MLSQKALEEFKAIWRRQFGEDISDEKAVEAGTKLLNLFDVVYRPIKKEWLNEYKKKEANQ